MKKLLLILVLVLIPLNIKAAEYDVKSANLKITIPDDWYVFTRENIDTKEVEDVKKELMKKFFETNSAYISAATSRIEFVLTESDPVDFQSLSDFPDEKVAEIAADMGAINQTKDYRVYINNYKYVLFNRKSGDYYMNVYATVINYRWHLFTFQKHAEFTADEITKNKKIIDSIEYDIIEVKPSKKEEIKEEKPKKKWILAYIISGIIILALIGNLILKKRGKEA